MKNNVKQYRTQQGMTQETLADALGVSRQTIIAIESGKYLPSLGLVFKIARQFKTSIENVFIDDGGNDEEEL
jgi:putative transcriptional regulator